MKRSNFKDLIAKMFSEEYCINKTHEDFIRPGMYDLMLYKDKALAFIELSVDKCKPKKGKVVLKDFGGEYCVVRLLDEDKRTIKINHDIICLDDIESYIFGV